MQSPLAPTSAPASECSKGRLCPHQGDQEGLGEAFQGSWHTRPLACPQLCLHRLLQEAPLESVCPRGSGTRVGAHVLCPGPSTSPELVKYLLSNSWKDH